MWGWPYLTYLCGVILSKKVQISPLHATTATRDQIIEEVNAIPCHTFSRSVPNCRKRLQKCVDADGRHLRNIIFQKC